MKADKFLVAALLLGGCQSPVGHPGSDGKQGAGIPYRLSRPMRVSLNVYDARGEIVRSLLCGAPRQQGRQAVPGRDPLRRGTHASDHGSGHPAEVGDAARHLARRVHRDSGQPDVRAATQQFAF